jgi:hypothetical protein
MDQPIDSAEKRALKKLRAEGFARMPSPEVLRSATEYERAKQTSLGAIDQALVQRAQFAGMVLGNPEVSKALPREKFDKLAEKAGAFLESLIDQSGKMLAERDELSDVSVEEAGDEPSLHAV